MIFDIEFDICFPIFHRVPASADLHAGATIGRSVHLVKAQVAFARNGHAERTVAKHLDADRLTFRTVNSLCADGVVDGAYLLEVQLACKHDDIGKTSIKFQCLRIRDVQLGREVYFLPDAVGIGHRRYIGRYDRGNTGFLRSVDDGAHERQVFVVNYRIHCQIAFYTTFFADRSDLVQVIRREII